MLNLSHHENDHDNDDDDYNHTDKKPKYSHDRSGDYSIHYIDYKHYSCDFNDSAKLKEILERHGFAIALNVIEPELCDKIYDGTWSKVEHLSRSILPILRDHPVTWESKSMIGFSHHMLAQHNSVGLHEEAWELRAHENVNKVFCDLHGVDSYDKLLTSTDGWSHFARPATVKHTEKQTFSAKNILDRLWLHADQSYDGSMRSGYIQSWVTMLPVEAGQATLVVFDRSHRYHNEFVYRFRSDAGSKNAANWQLLGTEDEVEWYIQEKKCKLLGITCPKGAMVLWKSETVHCGAEATVKPAQFQQRCVYYICQTPKSLATEEQLLRKQKYLIMGRTTTHQPDAFEVFGKFPRMYSKEDQYKKNINYIVFDPNTLTDRQLKLAGFENRDHLRIRIAQIEQEESKKKNGAKLLFKLNNQ